MACRIIKQVMPILNFASRNTFYGVLERNSAVTKICELSKRYGVAWVFLTISLDDINNPLGLSLRSSNNADYPPDGLLSHDFNMFIEQNTILVGEGTIPCDRHV